MLRDSLERVSSGQDRLEPGDGEVESEHFGVCSRLDGEGILFPRLTSGFWREGKGTGSVTCMFCPRTNNLWNERLGSHEIVGEGQLSSRQYSVPC